MKTLLYTSPLKVKIHTIRLEYGGIKGKFSLKVSEGEILATPLNSSQSDTFQLPAILRKVLLMQILQKQNVANRMRKISIVFCF